MKEDKVYLQHILEAIEKIQSYLSAKSFEDFEREFLLQDGMIRQLEIIGEASRHISEETKRKMPNIHWASIIGMRNKLIHDYLGVDIEVVWETVKTYIPELKKEVKNFMR